MVALTWGGANQVGTWTFLVLWVMRLSAKLNVFLGVPNLTEEFLPEHLRYLKSFLARAADEPAVPGLGDRLDRGRRRSWSRTRAAPAPAARSRRRPSPSSATLLALAVLEHWFLVLPLPDAALWSWALRLARGRAADAEPSTWPAGLAPLPRYATLSAIGRRT